MRVPGQFVDQHPFLVGDSDRQQHQDRDDEQQSGGGRKTSQG